MNDNKLTLRISNWLSELSKYFLKLSNKQASPIEIPEISYASLAPNSTISDADGKDYFDALKWALNSKTIKNIALTGPYGSGKSSVLLSFQSKYPEYKFLNVSLATFGNATVANGGNTNGIPIDHSAIELSILQQIFYNKPQNAIPDSRFKRIVGLSRNRLFLNLTLFVVWVAAITFLYDIGLKKRIDVVDRFLFKYDFLFSVLSYLIFFIGTIFIISKGIRIFRRFNFNKIKLSSNNLEVEGEGGQSVLNAHFDELIYFFQATKYDGLIIEDLDRFRDTEIFSKLRELNQLLNHSEQITKKPIVFIYAIKDDLFIVGDRTKFFDFIIPIVPIVNSSNAGDYLFQMLADNNIIGHLKQDFIYTIGLFINDMRMVKNIYNEYCVYRKKLSIDAQHKLMGIIAYKNIYPVDFSDLHLGKGMIFDVFSKKQESLKDISLTIDSEITEFEEKITQLETEVAQNKNELNAIYVLKILSKITDFDAFYINGRVTISSACLDENFLQLMRANPIIYYNTNGHTRSSDITFKNIENEVDSKNTYEQRAKMVEEKGLKIINSKELHRKKSTENQQLKGLSISELLKSYSIDKFSKNIGNEKLLVYLLERGSIDELYPLYISNFYEGTLKKNDQLFLIGVKNRNNNTTNAPYSFALSNYNEITIRLSLDDYMHKDVLNFGLINWMVQHNISYKHQLQAVLDQLRLPNPETWQFLEASRMEGDAEGSFFHYVCITWLEFWKSTVLYFSDSIEVQIEWFISILRSCTIANLSSLDFENSISLFIEKWYFNINTKVSKDLNVVKKLQLYIQERNLKISTIEKHSSKEALDFLVENNSYEQRYDNILTILLKKSKVKLRAETEVEFSISDILQSGCEALINYLNIYSNYGLDLILSGPHTVIEDEDVIINLLNSDNISIDRKNTIIVELNFLLQDLSSIPVKSSEGELDIKIPQELLTNKKIKLDWTNILYYHEHFGLDSFLIGLIDSMEAGQIVDKLYIGALSGQNDLLRQFVRELSLNTEVTENTFEKLSNSFSLIDDVGYLSPDPVKLKILIEKNLVIFKPQNVSIIKQIDRALAYELIIKEIQYFFKESDNYDLQVDDFIGILSQNGLSSESELKIIEMIDTSDFRTNSKIAEIALTKIVNKNLTTINPDISFALLESGADLPKKVALFKRLMLSTEPAVLFEQLPNLGSSYDRLFGGHNEFEDGELDTEILNFLKNNNYILEFSTKDDKIHIIRQ
ncbi:hypothetical protein AB6805_13920 [Chitinophaga sp. RCC_12]|uniref:YobI family P-loop NTPase n=1 Tax=Chitinophaga sp. RCC_12 TaxID=3239226 RepID=UPI0035235B9B